MKRWVLLAVLVIEVGLLALALGRSATVVWQTSYNLEGVDLSTFVAPAWDGLLVVGDENRSGVWRPIILYVSPDDGSVIWSIDLSSQNDRMLSEFVMLGDLAYFVGFNNDTDNTPNLWVVAVDREGNVVHEASVGLPNLREIGTSIETDGQYLYVSGMAEISTNFYRAAVWVLDADLNVVDVGMPNVPGLGTLATSLTIQGGDLLLVGVSVMQISGTTIYTDGFAAMLDKEDPSSMRWVQTFDLADRDLFLRVKAGGDKCYTVGVSGNYSQDSFGYVLSLSIEDGSPLASFEVDSDGDDIIGDVFLYGDVLYIVGGRSGDTYLARLDQDLVPVWEQTLDLGGNNSGSSIYVFYTSNFYIAGEETESDQEGDIYLARLSDNVIRELDL